MGGVCSRKRSQLVDEGDSLQTSPRFSKTSSLKWPLLALPRSNSDVSGKGQGNEPGRCPSLMELCVARVCQDIDNYSTFAMLPRDLSQQIFNELVNSNRLTESSLQIFRDCALQDIGLGEYPGVKDAWMEVVASQRRSLLSVDISCSEVTDSGIDLLKDCSSMQSLACNYCDQISESGLVILSGLSNLTSLSFKGSNAVTAEGMKAFANLVNLINLDLEGCLKIHGGLIHLKDLTKLESLNLRYCNYIVDSDIKYLTDLTNLKDLQLSCCKITDLGVSYIRGLQKLTHLNLEGCPVTASFCLEAISGFSSLLVLNLSRWPPCHGGGRGGRGERISAAGEEVGGGMGRRPAVVTVRSVRQARARPLSESEASRPCPSGLGGFGFGGGVGPAAHDHDTVEPLATDLR